MKWEKTNFAEQLKYPPGFSDNPIQETP